jgi:hypothetical protein
MLSNYNIPDTLYDDIAKCQKYIDICAPGGGYILAGGAGI